jgi:molybdopterin molybdotransferase
MMLSLEEARARWLTALPALAPERAAIGDAAGRVLAADLVADRPLPPFDYSAMDGYAVAASDCTGDGPWTLPVEATSRAGGAAPRLAPGTACRILTGAPIPPGADAVLMQENVAREGQAIAFSAKPKAGQHIRRAGEDLATGAVALRAGTRLRPGAIALAAMLGRSELVVVRRPVVTFLCTGDELVAPGDPPRPGSIPESNGAPLAALAEQAGASVRIAPIVADDEDATRRAVVDALAGTDVLVTVGGVSVGDHDHVRPALEGAGVALDFWKVAIKPGKPIAVGRRGAQYVLGLPGNPASALVTFVVFGAPLIRGLQGDHAPSPTLLPAELAAGRKRSPDRIEFVRATLAARDGRLIATAHDNQASGAATSLAASDGLVVVPAGEGPIAAGAKVDFLRWSDA